MADVVVLRTDDQIATLLYPVYRTHLGYIIICGFQGVIILYTLVKNKACTCKLQKLHMP